MLSATLQAAKLRAKFLQDGIRIGPRLFQKFSGILRPVSTRDGHRSDGRRSGFGFIWGRWQSENPLWHLPGLLRFASVGRAPLPVPDFRQILAVFVDVLLVLDEFVPHLLFQVFEWTSPGPIAVFLPQQ